MCSAINGHFNKNTMITQKELFDIAREVSPELVKSNNGYDLEIYVNLKDIEDNVGVITELIPESVRANLFTRLLLNHRKRSDSLDERYTVEKLKLYVGDSGYVEFDLIATKEPAILETSKERLDAFIRLITTLQLLNKTVLF